MFQRHKNLFLMGLMCIFMILCAALTNAQSIVIQNSTIMVENPDLEKAVKSSASFIKAKKNSTWTVKSVTVESWKVNYTDGNYTLYRNDMELYQSSAIAAIRAYYLAFMLERETPVLKPL